ncbi:MAG: winged helix-turn-helix transcriptional regulator [Candidatus Thorarchaeota archaeon]
MVGRKSRSFSTGRTVVLKECFIFIENELIEREIIQEKPFQVHCFLTEKGRDVKVIFAALKGWEIKWGESSVRNADLSLVSIMAFRRWLLTGPRNF